MIVFEWYFISYLATTISIGHVLKLTREALNVAEVSRKCLWLVLLMTSSYQLLHIFSWNLFIFVKARYQNSLQVKLDIASREEFTLIERGLAREKTQEVPEETGKIVQDSMFEEDVMLDSSDEVVSKGQQPSIITFDLNKTPEENDIC
ncbi:hypothetical protein AHAS_Ahas13G0373700 [Arachis hypogaea]